MFPLDLFMILNDSIYIYVMWHVDTLLGNDRRISYYTTAVAK
jgi:hypothetical protein